MSYKIFTIIPLSLIALNVPAQTTLCQPEEKIFFSCKLEKKIVSVCEGKKIPGYLEYRFGTNQKIEMIYKATAHEKTKFKKTEVLYASNPATLIWFRVNQYRYILNFPMRGGPVLEVRQGQKTISEMACKQGWGNALGEPEEMSEFIIHLPDTSPSEVDKIFSTN